MANPPNPSLSDVKTILSITDATKDAVLTLLLNGAIEFTERRTRREFSTGVGSRFYNGKGKGYLYIDDFQSGTVTSLQLLNTDKSVWKTYATTEYATIGAKGTQDSIHQRIDILNNISENPYRILGPSPYVFPEGVQNVVVTATFGTWALLPAGLQSLIADLVVMKYTRPRNLKGASVGGESLSFSDRDLTDDMLNQLEAYKKPLVRIWPS